MGTKEDALGRFHAYDAWRRVAAGAHAAGRHAHAVAAYARAVQCARGAGGARAAPSLAAARAAAWGYDEEGFKKIEKKHLTGHALRQKLSDAAKAHDAGVAAALEAEVARSRDVLAAAAGGGASAVNNDDGGGGSGGGDARPPSGGGELDATDPRVVLVREESVVAIVNGVHDMHLRRTQYVRYPGHRRCMTGLH